LEVDIRTETEPVDEESRDLQRTTADLLEFQRKLQGCKSARETLFVAVNQSFSLLRFDQAVIWRPALGSRVSIAAVSGLAELTADSPYSQWLARAVDFIRINKPGRSAVLSFDEFPEALVEDGRDWVHDQLLHCALYDPEGRLVGGLLFHRDEPFDEADRAIGEWLGSSVGYSLWAWRERGRGFGRMLHATRWLVLGLLVIVALCIFVPVRLSAVASAEVTPEKPIPITSPTEGVVGRIVVQPNQIVKAGETLFELDDTSIRNRLAVAIKALDIARADYQRAANKAFSDEPSKAELLVLDSKGKEKAAEVAYLTELLARLRVASPQGGVAIFNDAEDWRGRPVLPGERIMLVADPSLVGVTVYLPPEDAVELSVGAEVTVFLNINPLSSLRAKIVQTSYEATVMPDSTLAYVIKAAFIREQGQDLPRIGQRGTAKVYSEEVSLGYYLLRKPILFVRKSFGL
jgi:multidrug resistance efflux pump